MSDLKAQVTYWNKHWLEFTGQNYEQSLGQAWEKVVHPDDFEYLLNQYLAATSQRQSYSIEARTKRWDGVHRWFLFTGGLGTRLMERLQAMQEQGLILMIVKKQGNIWKGWFVNEQQN